LYAARDALGTVDLESVTDAATILDLLRAHVKQFGEFDHSEMVAFNNASKYLVQAISIA
jgi:hypothetical protein